MKTKNAVKKDSHVCHVILQPGKAKKRQGFKSALPQQRKNPLCRVFENDQLIYSDDFIREAYALESVKRFILRED